MFLHFRVFQRLISFWSNFAKYGDPNGAAGDSANIAGAGGGSGDRSGAAGGSESDSGEESTWPEYKEPHWRHLVVNDRDLKVDNLARVHILGLW